ncbi:MAG: hypothetical protein WA988_20805 [Candidatus Nanopelagicales bacterium]
MTSKPVRFTQAARRKKIGKAHALWVMNNHKPIFTMRNRTYWLAMDSRGVELEIITVEDDAQVVVIHCMPHALRQKGIQR